MYEFISGLFAFVISVAVVYSTTLQLYSKFGNRAAAVAGGALIGGLLSVVWDFTLTMPLDHYERSFYDVAVRAGTAAVFALVIAFFSVRPLAKR